MTIEDLIRLPYEERQLVVFSKATSTLCTNSLQTLMKELYADIKKHPIKHAFQQLISSSVTNKVFWFLVSEMFKSDKTITYIPVSKADSLNLPSENLRLGEVYVAHPISPYSYYPISVFHRSLHTQKVLELIRILESLCANKITLSHRRGYKDTSAISGEVKAGKKPCHVGVEGHIQSDNTENQKVIWEGTYDTINRQPQLPRNLLWYDYEEEWKHAVASIQDAAANTIHLVYTYDKDYGLNIGASISTAKIPVSGEAEFKHSHFEITEWDVCAEFNDKIM